MRFPPCNTGFGTKEQRSAQNCSARHRTAALQKNHKPAQNSPKGLGGLKTQTLQQQEARKRLLQRSPLGMVRVGPEESIEAPADKPRQERLQYASISFLSGVVLGK